MNTNEKTDTNGTVVPEPKRRLEFTRETVRVTPRVQSGVRAGREPPPTCPRGGGPYGSF